MRSDPDVLWPTTTLNGSLLHPSRPATTLDAGWAGGPMGGGDSRSAHSVVSCASDPSQALIFHSVLVAGSGAPHVPSTLTAGQLWPRPSAATPHWVWQWNSSACTTEGGDASACAFPLQEAPSSIQRRSWESGTPSSSDAVPWSLWTVSPALPSGYALLGETSK